MTDDPRRLLLEIFDQALRAVDGRVRVSEYLRMHLLPSPVYLIAIGKAACSMARGAHEVLGSSIRDALIVTKDGNAEMLPWPVREAGHPVPDARSLEAGKALMAFVGSMPSDARALVLLSGGASALVEQLPLGIELLQWQQINEWLLASGLEIGAINRIRKRMSLIKGGRLAALLSPRQVTCLAISDVEGNYPCAIGSGPLVAADSFDLPVEVALPDFVQAAIEKSPKFPLPNDPCFTRVDFRIIVQLEAAKAAAANAAEQLGYRSLPITDFIKGDAIDAGRQLARTLMAASPGLVHIWGGETTMALPPQPGRGGRNQSLALAAALELDSRDGVYLLSAGTDGTDGPTSDAGALVDGGTVARGESHGFDANDALARADAGTFLEASGDLVQTGPTGTNVMDLMLGLRTK